MNRSGGPAPAWCGERLVAQLPPEVLSAAGLRIVGTPRSPSAGERPPAAGTANWSRKAAAWSGIGVRRIGPASIASAVTYRMPRVFAQAIEIPAEESELEYLSPEVIRDRLAAGREIYYRSAAAEEERRDDLWKWFAVACVVCGLGELTSLMVFRT